VAVLEAPDDATVTALLLAAVTTGAYKATKTTVLVTPETMVDILCRTGSVAFRPPGR
jgi:uncharacterized protein with GYD domain